MTAIEKVARAVVAHMRTIDPTMTSWDEATDDMRKFMHDLARAAIEAMREPTSGMASRACNALKRHVDSFTEEERVARWPGRQDANGWRVPNKEKHRVRYQAMIDAALAEEPK